VILLLLGILRVIFRVRGSHKIPSISLLPFSLLIEDPDNRYNSKLIELRSLSIF
jgi:hypothetical protein